MTLISRPRWWHEVMVMLLLLPVLLLLIVLPAWILDFVTYLS